MPLVLIAAAAWFGSATATTTDPFNGGGTRLDFDAGGTLSCLDQRSHSQDNGWLSFNMERQNPLRLHVSRWSSSRAAAAVVYILLTEHLGYAVEAWQAPESELDTYRHLAGAVDLNFELYPSLKTQEIAAAKSRKCRTNGVQSSCLTFGSRLGYIGRSGWFFSNSTPTSGNEPVDFHDYPNHTNLLSRALWKDADYLRTLGSLAFVSSSEVTTNPNLCASNFDHTRYLPNANFSIHGGVYDCAAGTWTPHAPNCCVRARALAGQCGAREPRCIALLSFDPGYDVGYSEKMIVESG